MRLSILSIAMIRLLPILVLVFALTAGQQRPPLPDQITDDEDDLAADMPQNGPDTGSGMEPDEVEDTTPSESPRLSTTMIVVSVVVPTEPEPEPEPEAEEVTVTKKEEVTTTVFVKPVVPIAKPTSLAKDEEITTEQPVIEPAAGLSTPALIGIIAAVIIAIILIIVIIACLVKRSRKNSHRHPHQQHPSPRGRQQVPQSV